MSYAIEGQPVGAIIGSNRRLATVMLDVHIDRFICDPVLCCNTMVSTADTIDVSADVYSNAIPDWFEGDTVPVEVTAFSDKIYLDFPDFGSLERRARNRYLNADSTLHGSGDMYPIDRSEITDFEDALDIVLENKDAGREYVPDRTTQFCMSASSVFFATVEVTNRGSLDVEPIMRKMNVLNEQERDYVHGDPDAVSTLHIGDKSDTSHAHLKLVEEFCTTIGGFQDDEYWQGYKRAANKFGDERYDWPDVAWDCFSERWDGNKELLLDVGLWLAEEGYAVCSKSKAFFPVPEWSTPTGSYVATISDVYAGSCPECGADKDEHWECIKSSNRTRVPNVYKCQACGETKRGITTG